MKPITDTLRPLHGGAARRVEYTEVSVPVHVAQAHLQLVPEAVVIISPTNTGKSFVALNAWQSLDLLLPGHSLYLGEKLRRQL